MEHVEAVEVDGAGGHGRVAQVQSLAQLHQEPGIPSSISLKHCFTQAQGYLVTRFQQC